MKLPQERNHPTMTSSTHDPHPALQEVSFTGGDLGNRLVVAPMTRVSAGADGTPTPAMAEYYQRFAVGGFGMVITEGIYTDGRFSQGYLNQPGLVTPEHVTGWRPVTAAVRRTGTRIVAQLMHAGALSQGNRYRAVTAGPSAVRPKGEKMPEYGGRGRWPTPEEMSAEEIAEVVAGFTAAAGSAHRAGFDGVEVHAANGYLLDQFLTDYTNRRDDDYGGSVAHRIRLTSEVIAAIKREVPDGFWVGVRLSQTKINDFAYRWPGGAEDATVIFESVTRAGADFLHVASEGRDWIETARLDNGATITALAREVSGLPVIANGRMHDLDQAADVIGDGHADLLSFARSALANPDLPHKLASGVSLRPFDPGMIQPMATLDNTAAWLAANEPGR